MLGDAATAVELGVVSSHHKEQVEHLGHFAKQVEEGDNCQAVTIIPYFKLNTTYDQRWRVRSNCPDVEHRQSLSGFSFNHQAEEKKGKAPRGKLARDCQ